MFSTYLRHRYTAAKRNMATVQNTGSRLKRNKAAVVGHTGHR